MKSLDPTGDPWQDESMTTDPNTATVRIGTTTYAMPPTTRVRILRCYRADRTNATRATARHWALDFAHCVDDVTARRVANAR